MTIMNGPVYRYESGADNSKRWPAYWDGRWFLHNNGGASIKHGLLLNPDTDQDAGLPVYADSLRDTLAWGGAYMDSKFGPDGALYVQTYDGFFRAGAAIGIYRYDYVGGAPTPGSNPRAFPIGALKVRFSSAGSGGVSWAWDFGDGQTSTEANPTHTYANTNRYTATLTVTYADGKTDTKTIDVDLLASTDETAPVTTYTLTPPTPGAGGTYTRPVTVTLSATDPTGGSGVDTTEYRVNGGEWADYERPLRREQPGMYLIEFRSTDRTGNVEEIKSVAFTIAVAANCPTNFNDEFNGTELDPKWTILRGDAAARSFVDGALQMKVRNGDMISTQNTARNVLLQDAPSGSWQIQTKLDVSTLTNEGEQAGFILWQRENPNTFAKITYISKGTFSQYEWVATRNGTAQISAGPQISTPDGDVWLRVSANGSGTYIAEGSTNGEDWQQIAGEITDLGDPETLKFGIKVSDTADSENYAAFDWFRVDCSDRVPPRTTATLPPIDGKLGWYKTAPKVTLTADDGALGQVAKIAYKIDGGAERTYEGPFTIAEPGQHVVQYYATDVAENVEAGKRLAFRVDGAAPAAEATMTGNADTGPLRVTLNTARRRCRLRQRPDGVPRRRRPVDDLLGQGRRGHLRWLGSLARPVEAGPGRSLRPDDGRLRRHHAGRRPRDAVVPGEDLRGLQAEVPVPRGSHRRRLLQRWRLRALPEPGADAACRRVLQGRVRCDRAGLGRDQLRPRDPALRRRVRRDAQDGLDLHVRQQHDRTDRQREAPRRVGGLRDPGRRPDLHDQPQR